MKTWPILLSTVLFTSLTLVTSPAFAKTNSSSTKPLTVSSSATTVIQGPPSPPFNISEIPSGYYTFTGPGQMTYSDGTQSPSTFTSMLSSLQSEVIKNFKADASDDFHSPLLTCGFVTLDPTGSQEAFLWGAGLSSYLSNLSSNVNSSRFSLTFGNQSYSFFVPPGRDHYGRVINGNQAFISSTVSSVDTFISAVQDAALAGSMADSYDIFSIYPSSQVPVNKLLTVDSQTGQQVIDPSKSGVSLDYSFVNFYNPLLGLMAPSSLTLGPGQNTFWQDKEASISLSVASRGYLRFSLDSTFSTFLSSLHSSDNTFTSLKRVAGVKSVGSFTTQYSGQSERPVDLADGAFQLVVPSVFLRSADSDTYRLDQQAGVSLFSDAGLPVKLQITRNYLYTDNAGTYKRLGSYADYTINPDSLQFISIRVDAKGQLSPNGVEEGAVLPLEYYEGLMQFSTSGGGVAKPTDRLLDFGPTFSGNITLDGQNADLFSVSDALDGQLSVPLRNYAFAVGADYTNIQSHTDLATSPLQFQVAIAFENSGNMKGFYMFLNDYYAGNTDLTNWLQSSPAQAKLGTEAQSLYNYVTGAFTINQSSLTYQQFERMQQIRNFLSQSNQTELQTIIAVVTMVFGIFIIFYSILLMIAYWLDIFNVLIDFSFLHILTRGRLYPIASKDALDYVTFGQGQVKYVTIKDILIIMFFGLIVGVLFIDFTPVLQFLLYMYFTIKTWMGGL